MIATEIAAEKVVLVGAETYGNRETFDVSLSELASLAETAGALVLATFTQKKNVWMGNMSLG